MSDMEKEFPDTTVVLDCLKILTTPVQGTTSSNNDLSTFEQLLKGNLDKFMAEIEQSRFKRIWMNIKDQTVEESSTRWSYTCHCLSLLDILCTATENALKLFKEKEEQSKQGRELKPSQAPPLSPDTLSVGQQKTVLTAIQFIIVLGISPNLQEGVGLQTNKRSGFGEVIDFSNEDATIDNVEKSLRMIKCLRVLMKCSKIESLGTLIFSRHLADILAALLQLIHGQHHFKKQNKLQSNTVESTDIKQKTTSGNKNQDFESSMVKNNRQGEPETWTPASVVDMTMNKLSLYNSKNLESVQNEDNKSHCIEKMSSNQNCVDEKDMDFCEESLNQLLENLSQPLLVRELMVLQGGPGRAPVPKGDGVNKQVKPVLIRAPAWLRKICGQLLTGILMKSHGVLHVLHGMLGNAVADASGNLITDWRKFDAVAKVIASCPKMSTSVEEYYKLVCPQILSLLHQPNKQVARHFLRVACSTISNMVTNNPELAKSYLIIPLLKPLLSCTQDNDFEVEEEQKIVLEEQSLSLCIEDIHKVFVSGVEPNNPLCRYLIAVLHSLFYLYCFTKQGVSHLRSACHEIITTCLKQCSTDVSMECLKCLALDIHPETLETWNYLHSNLMFAAGGEGGVVIVTKPKEGYSVPEAVLREGTVDLLKDLERHGLAGEFFLFMLKELSDIIKAEITNSNKEVHTGRNYLEADKSQTYQKKISVLQLLASMCETIGPSCLKNTQQTLNFVEITLERAVHVLNACEDEATTVFENETLTMAMGLLTSVLSGHLECKDEDRNHMKKMLPLLQSLADYHPEVEVQEMASDLRVAIATHGVVWSERLSQRKEEPSKQNVGNQGNKKDVKTEPLIEVFEDGKDTQALHNNTEMGTSISIFQEALKELCNSLLPVRGHGLISLCKLVEQSDKEAMEKQEVVLKIFQENLNHPDSYLYSTAAKGLTLLADKYPDQIIPKLVKEFANFDKSERSVELRMKLGECLVQSTRKLGDMGPKYRDLLLPAILSGARDSESMVRASSLSNLGEMCRILKFSLGNVISEIFSCCQSLLKTDHDPEVRKAAALLTTLLLQGLGKDSFKVLDSHLRDLYQLLKMTLKTESDEKVKDHIILSLNELDSIMRECLFPKQSLQKKIRILDQT